MRLVHITRTTRTFGGYCNLVVPARSAPVYVHQLQAIPNIFGSNDITFLSVKSLYGAIKSSRGKARDVREARPAFRRSQRSEKKRNAAYGLFIMPYLKLHETFHLRQYLLIGKVTGNNGRRRADRRTTTASFTQSFINFRNPFIRII